MSTRLFSFVGGDTGAWRVVKTEAIVGQALPAAKRLAIVAGSEIPSEPRAAWVLRGITSNERYVDREERRQIVAKVLDLGRPEATCAALIPIRKNEAWWALTQEERLGIFKEQSHHTQDRTGAFSHTGEKAPSLPGSLGERTVRLHHLVRVRAI